MAAISAEIGESLLEPIDPASKIWPELEIAMKPKPQLKGESDQDASVKILIELQGQEV